MKSRKIISALGITALLVTPYAACAQWEILGGPDVSSVYDIESDGSYLYASTDEGIFRSKDDGQSWSPVNSGLPRNEFFDDLAVVGTNLFVLIERNSGIYEESRSTILRSTDNGETWNEVSTGLPEDMSYLVATGEQLFVIGDDQETYKSAIYRSADSGESWRPIGGQGLDAYGLETLAVNGNNLYATIDDEVYRSANYGEDWTLVFDENKASDIWTDEKGAIPGKIFVGDVVASSNSIFLNAFVIEHRSEKPVGGYFERSSDEKFRAIFGSTDDGDSWKLLNWETTSDLPGICTAYIYSVSSGEYLFACAGNGLFRSKDNGKIWSRVSAGLPGEDNEEALSIAETLAAKGGVLYAGTWDGVYLSEDSGESWSAANSGLPKNAYVRSFAVSGDALFASIGGHGLFVYDDQSNSWTYVIGGPAVAEAYYVIPTTSSLIAKTEYRYYRSGDDGASWTALKPLPFLGSGIAAIAAYGEEVFAATYKRIYHSANGGRTWQVTYGDAPGIIVYGLVVTEQYLFRHGGEYGIWRSADRGNSWTDINVDLPHYPSGPEITEGGLILVSTHEGIYTSIDYGDSWSLFTAQLPDPPYRVAYPNFCHQSQPLISDQPSLVTVGDNVFADVGTRVFILDGERTAWKEISSGLPADTPVWITASKSNLFAIACDGRIRRLLMPRLQH